MQVNASAAAVELVRERGGRLYVWIDPARCCGGTTFLAASTEPEEGREFRRVPADGVELYVSLARLPERLDLEASGRLHKKVRAYWEGCAWVV
jgi:hypothetical protein